jgi:hypothetical protein
VFDPCAAWVDSAAREAVRILARRAGAEIDELGEQNRCCGWGGHMGTANPELYGDVLDRRAAQSDLPYIVYCANCEDAFLRRGKECVHILDIALSNEFGIGAVPHRWGESAIALGDGCEAAAMEGATPHLQEKRDRALALKGEMASLYRTEDAGPGPAMPFPKGARSTRGEDGQRSAVQSLQKLAGQRSAGGKDGMIESDVVLRIPDAVRSRMDGNLMLDSDVAETVLTAERTGDKFTEREGMSLAFLAKPNVTYWVEYRFDDDGACEVHDAYSHRMRFEMD